jgi:hypothetical protein
MSCDRRIPYFQEVCIDELTKVESPDWKKQDSGSVSGIWFKIRIGGTRFIDALMCDRVLDKFAASRVFLDLPGLLRN